MRAALHLRAAASGSAFGYRDSGPASITLWPSLATRLRVLIYNGAAASLPPTTHATPLGYALPPKGLAPGVAHGVTRGVTRRARAAGDADACVPYIGNEEWISSLETSGVLAEKEAWRPW